MGTMIGGTDPVRLREIAVGFERKARRARSQAKRILWEFQAEVYRAEAERHAARHTRADKLRRMTVINGCTPAEASVAAEMLRRLAVEPPPPKPARRKGR
jgi:hypothetical protein